MQLKESLLWPKMQLKQVHNSKKHIFDQEINEKWLVSPLNTPDKL